MAQQNRGVVITGGSSGLGAACARAFAATGADVAIVARRPEALETVRREIASAAQGRVLAMQADVGDATAMRTCVSRALAAFGRVDVLVCSAGLGYQGSIEDTTPDIMSRLLEVNVLGTLNAVRAIAPYFLAQRSGHIIIVSSIVGKRAVAGYSAYSAAKFAQAGLAEALRTEMREAGVTVTTVFPVSVRTGFREAIAREFGVHVEGRGPTDTPEHVAAAVVRATRTLAAEVYPYRRARLLALLAAWAPGFTDRVVTRFARRQATASAATVSGPDDGR